MTAAANVNPHRDTSGIMRKVKSRDTAPELTFRRALWARGARYQVSPKALPGAPDLAFPRRRLAVFIDGDFWHGGQWTRRRFAALEEQFQDIASKGYWLKKLRRNMDRDCVVSRALQEMGWTVLRFWESDLRYRLEECIEMTLGVLNGAGTVSSQPAVAQKTFAEFFAGIGLVRMALQRHGWRCVFANDIDPEKYEMYLGQFSDAKDHFRLGDVHELEANTVTSATLATASFPCNDLSVAGSRGGLKGKQSSAYWGFVRVLKELGDRRPPLVLVENVPGFLTSHRGKDFEEALMALNDLGYSVDAFLLDAVHFVPQSRQRLFVVGLGPYRAGLEVAEQQGFYESTLRPRVLADFMLTHPQIRWRARRLPNPPESDNKLVDIIEQLHDHAPEWWDSKRTDYLLNQMSERHRRITDGLIKKSQWTYGTVFRRIRRGKSMAELRTDGIAGCLRTPRGGSGRQIVVKAGFGQCRARLLTPRECARLMGAGEYNISVPLNQALFGFGDAVCVPVVEWIAEQYLNPTVAELLHGDALVPAA